MLVMIKNNIERICMHKVFLIVANLLTIVTVAAAIILTNMSISKINIAAVNIEKGTLNITNTNKVDVTYLHKDPSMSALVEGRYDAIISIDNNEYKIKCIKNKDIINNAIYSKNQNSLSEINGRMVGSNIIGYIMMFIFIQGIVYARLFAEDKEKHLTERILLSPIKFSSYIGGYVIFIFALIFIPTIFVFVVANLFNINIGFSILQYLFLVGILSLLSSSFALCISSFFKNSNTSNMLGNSIIILTSILGGSFYSIIKEGGLLNKFLLIIPQKSIISYANALERGIVNFNYNCKIIYVILISIIFLIIAVMKTRKEYIYKE